MVKVSKQSAAILLEKEVKQYLTTHPEVRQYLERLGKAEKDFGGALRLLNRHLVVRDVPSGSTSELEVDAALSRTDS